MRGERLANPMGQLADAEFPIQAEKMFGGGVVQRVKRQRQGHAAADKSPTPEPFVMRRHECRRQRQTVANQN